MEQNILSPTQQEILFSAKRDKTITDSFYLTGGTALSHYYLHHRFSEDFDFFTPSELDDTGVNKLHAITTRQRGRDYVDLYEIIHRGNILLTDLQKKYRVKFDIYIAPEEWAKHFARILDATDQPRFLGERSWKEIENYFLDQAKEYASKVIR